MTFDLFIKDFLFIGKGLALTLPLLGGASVLGLFFGILWVVSRYHPVGGRFVRAFISLVRGTPLLLQLSLIYFSIPALTDVPISVFGAGVVALALNSSAYVAEILRSGIESLSKGQFEAARTLGIPPFYMWKDIILPQVFRNVFPSMISELVALLKETALISTIGGVDIMRMSQILSAERYTYFAPLCIAGAYYYGLVLLIEWAGRVINARKITLCR